MIDDFKQHPERPRQYMDTGRNLHNAAGGAAMRSALNRPSEPASSSSEAPAAQDGSAESAPQEPAFMPPEQIASLHEPAVETPSYESSYTVPQHSNNRFERFWHALTHPNRKQALIMVAVALCVIGGTVALVLTHKSRPAQEIVATKAPATPALTPKPIVSPLTGLPVSLDKTTLPVTGVMIENSPDARPQSGLDQAGVVFEAIAEGGITRFLALYQEADPGVLGPVRSARPYYLQWAMAFDAGYAHVGGSPEALQAIKDLGVRDLDQFFNAGAYHRISSRYAPHNMYTSMDALRKLEQDKGYTSSTFTPFIRAAKEAPSKNPTARSIDFSISGAYYSVHYDYDAASNSYKRSEGGAPHIDNETKQQLSPKVVIALAMPYSLESDGYHSDYNTQGSGKMLLFQNGTVTPGTWSKGGPKDQFVFKDDAGRPMQLNPGQTWITVLSDISKASYKP